MSRNPPFIAWEGRVNLLSEKAGRYRIVCTSSHEFSLEEMCKDALGQDSWQRLADGAHPKIIAFAFYQLGEKNHE